MKKKIGLKKECFLKNHFKNWNVKDWLFGVYGVVVVGYLIVSGCWCLVDWLVE